MSELARFHLGYSHKTFRTYPFHRHPYIEIVYYDAGSGTVEMAEEKTFSFTRNSVILHPPGMVHNQVNRVPGYDHCLFFEYLVPWNHSWLIPRLTDSRLRQEVMGLANIKVIHNADHQKICNLRATALLLELLELATASANIGNVESTLDTQLANAYLYFQNNFDIIGNLEDVAAIHGLSPDYFRHQFTRKYGLSPKKFLLSLRLEHARKLLQVSPLPQKTIAAQCGFGSLRYFNNRFHHYFGMTPGEYRHDKK
jgi:AraC-like DNA-binding protein